MDSLSVQGNSQPYVSTVDASAADTTTASLQTGASAAGLTGTTNDLYSLAGGSSGNADTMMELMQNIVQMMMGFVERLMTQLFGGATGAVNADPTGGCGNSSGAGGTGGSNSSSSGSEMSSSDPVAGGSSATDPLSADPNQTTAPSEPSSGREPAHNGGGCHTGIHRPSPAEKKPHQTQTLEATTDDKGQIVVTTEDGYVIRCEGKEQAWSITGPDGKVTRIWGDPHVQESDGDRWDFVENSSFSFGHNKITCEVSPQADGTSLTSRITVYNGDERVTVSDIKKDKPVITTVSLDARQHDAGLNDGTTYRLEHEQGSTEEQWVATN